MIDVPKVEDLLETLEEALRLEIERRALENPLMIGIHSGGAWIAEVLHRRLEIREPLGKLDISFYRDDFSRIGMHPKVQTSQLPFKLEGRPILLIDDVFYTGRTVRAALNEIFDYGRPAAVVLGVLLERNGREIPLRPDCRGGALTLPKGQRIKLMGTQSLKLSMHTV